MAHSLDDAEVDPYVSHAHFESPFSLGFVLVIIYEPTALLIVRGITAGPTTLPCSRRHTSSQSCNVDCILGVCVLACGMIIIMRQLYNIIYHAQVGLAIDPTLHITKLTAAQMMCAKFPRRHVHLVELQPRPPTP